MSNRGLAGILGVALVLALGMSLLSAPAQQVRASTTAGMSTSMTGPSCSSGGGGCAMSAGKGSSCGAASTPDLEDMKGGTCPFSKQGAK